MLYTLTLKRGIAFSMDLFYWRKQVVEQKNGNFQKSLTLSLVDEKGGPIARWQFKRAWPSKYTTPTLNAKGNEIAIDTIEIVAESIQKIQ